MELFTLLGKSQIQLTDSLPVHTATQAIFNSDNNLIGQTVQMLERGQTNGQADTIKHIISPASQLNVQASCWVLLCKKKKKNPWDFC